ncbi:MAG: hypothetical protein NTZ35_08700 [Ignavibacteriales bacterium]|nr:hypothetical protein [Ignavibacteriales bacterium]
MQSESLANITGNAQVIPFGPDGFSAVVGGASGIYYYTIFVKVGSNFCPVEGNSPPEMVIE